MIVTDCCTIGAANVIAPPVFPVSLVVVHAGTYTVIAWAARLFTVRVPVNDPEVNV